MTLYVIDASVVIKWFAPEIQSEHAARLLAPSHTLIAPNLLPLEIASSLSKHVRKNEATREEARERLARVDEHIVLFSLRGLVDTALDLAIDHGITVYDALYAALSIREECLFVTADRPLYDALSTRYRAMMVWIEDIVEESDG